MTDETSKPDPSNQASNAGPQRVIKIGTQRPGSSEASPTSPAAQSGSAPSNASESTVPSAAGDARTTPPHDQPKSADPSIAADPSRSPAPNKNDSASYGGDESDLATGSQQPSRRPTAEELFPGSVIDQMTGDIEAELASAMGDLSLDDLMEQTAGSANSATTEVELDTRYSGRVIKVDRESVFVEFAGQNEGMAPKRMFSELPEPGTEIDVIPTRYLTDDGLYEVIVPGGSVDVQDWSDLSEGVVVEAKITGHNKGGLECEVNHIRGFMPVSHIELFRVDDLEGYVGQSLQCVVTEANESRRNLVLSRRAILEREREAAREQLLESLEVGQVVEGVVTRLQDFGAFVDLGGIDGLIHVSQLSWDRIQHPREVVEEGQHVQVRIEKLDTDSGRIGLSYRDLLEDPWDGAETKFEVGSIVEGVVSKIMEFGAFVRLAAGVEGLVHISEVAHHRITKVGAFLKEGQTVTVKVLSADIEAQRISLSIKAAQMSEAKPSDATDAAEEPEAEASPLTFPRSSEPLKGGLNRPSGGEEFGLKW